MQEGHVCKVECHWDNNAYLRYCACSPVANMATSSTLPVIFYIVFIKVCREEFMSYTATSCPATGRLRIIRLNREISEPYLDLIMHVRQKGGVADANEREQCPNEPLIFPDGKIARYSL